MPFGKQIWCACSGLGTHLSHAHLLTLADIDTVASAAQGAVQEAASAAPAATIQEGPFTGLAKVLESTLTVRLFTNSHSSERCL